jgi:hypothetical protein
MRPLDGSMSNTIARRETRSSYILARVIWSFFRHVSSDIEAYGRGYIHATE